MIRKINRGLNVPISGRPVQQILTGPTIQQVGLIGDDYYGMRPTMLVQPGDSVKLGQPLFTDKKTEGIIYTSPGAGTVVDVVRGKKRKFESIIIELSGDDESNQVIFDVDSSEISREIIRDKLVESGLWTSFRTRPFSRIPAPDSIPNSIFVTAIDTNPLAAEPELVINPNRENFVGGLNAIKLLTDGPVFVCTHSDTRVPGDKIPGVRIEEFAGPHPAGLPGTHIHFLDPVSAKKTVWHLGYQDVIAIGHFFATGRLMTERVVSVAGPAVAKPGLFSTRLGASVNDLVAGQLTTDNARIVSGSVLCGRKAESPVNFLGRYDLQISVLAEGNQREFLGWQKPGGDKFSVTKIYLGSWLKDKLFPMTTNINGSHRSMVPVGTYERVMPLDILPTQLLRALIVGDTDEAQQLGALELAEEDMGLCTFVCPGKYEFGKILRDNLVCIEKEG